MKTRGILFILIAAVVFSALFGCKKPEKEDNTQTTEEILIIPETITIKGEKYSTELTELELYAKELTNSDIEPLKYMTKLLRLNISGNSISDLSPLKGLTDLTYLVLHGNNISDVSALSGLTNLTRLILVNNKISDISALSGLTNLTELNLFDNKITYINSLSGLTNLTNLILSGNPLNPEQVAELQAALPKCEIIY